MAPDDNIFDTFSWTQINIHTAFGSIRRTRQVTRPKPKSQTKTRLRQWQQQHMMKQITRGEVQEGTNLKHQEQKNALATSAPICTQTLFVQLSKWKRIDCAKLIKVTWSGSEGGICIVPPPFKLRCIRWIRTRLQAPREMAAPIALCWILK